MATQTIDPKFYKPNNQPAPGFGETYLKLDYDKSNGDVIVSVYNIIGGVTGLPSEIYRNGVWKYNPGAITSVVEKEEVHSLVKEVVNEKIAKDKRNIIPAFVTENAPSQDTGSSGTSVPSADSGGFFESIGKSLGGDLGITPRQFESKNMKALFDKIGVLKYPIDIIDTQQDILKISQYTYTAPYGDVFKGKQKDTIFKTGAQRQSALKEFIQTLYLPIPNNVADSNSVNWGSGSEINTLSMGAAGNIGAAAGATVATKIAALIAENRGKAELAGILGSTEAANALASVLIGGITNPTTGAAIQSFILKKAGFEISPETILSRGYGVVANSNMELLFSGPMLRGFQFTYVLSPRSEREAKMCRNIIRFFKQGMAAKKKLSTGYGEASFLLSTPNVFKLEYKTVDEKGKQIHIEGLNKFKICALTGMNVSYSDGQWSAFKEGQPVRMQLSLAFKELEPVYESDYQESMNEGFKKNVPGYEDQPSIGPNDIGF